MTEETTSTGPASTEKPSTGKTALVDDIRTHFSGDAPLTEKITGFAKARPLTTALFATLAAGILFGGGKARRR